MQNQAKFTRFIYIPTVICTARQLILTEKIVHLGLLRLAEYLIKFWVGQLISKSIIN